MQPMMTEADLRLKLRKIEALFERPGTTGERNAAAAARERLNAKLEEVTKEAAVEYTFT